MDMTGRLVWHFMSFCRKGGGKAAEALPELPGARGCPRHVRTAAIYPNEIPSGKIYKPLSGL